MLTQVVTASLSWLPDEVIAERAILLPRTEELPEIALASRNLATVEETIESRLQEMVDH